MAVCPLVRDVPTSRLSAEEQRAALNLSPGARADSDPQAALETMRQGDVLAVAEVGVLTSDPARLPAAILGLAERGIGLLCPALSPQTLTGDRLRLVARSVGAGLTAASSTRSAQARAAAARSGSSGRPPALTSDQADEVQKALAAGEPAAEIARRMGCSTSTVYRIRRYR